MRNDSRWMGVVAVLTVAGAAYALDAVNGSTVTPLFSTVDVPASIVYPTGFDGVRWDDTSITRFELGTTVNGPPALMDVGTDGTAYFVVHGATAEGQRRYKGLISWDGTVFRHLVQDTLDPDPTTGLTRGSRVLSVAVSPVTAGALVAGWPVVLREVFPDSGGTASDRVTEVWSVDPTVQPPSQQLVHSLNTGLGGTVAVDGGGRLFVCDTGTIRRLTPTSSGYDESVLASGLDSAAAALGPDGSLYAFDGSTAWGLRRGTNDLLRIDGATGATSVHASVSATFGALRASAVDAAGTVWLTLQDGGTDVVVPVPAGASVSPKDAVHVASSDAFRIRSMLGVTGRGLLVAEWSSTSADAHTDVLLFEPSTAGGGGGSGGGNGGGGGKGKKR